MEIAQEVIDEDSNADSEGNAVNPMDKHFQSLDLKFMDPIRADSDEYSRLQEYVTSTHGRTHARYSGTILQAFRVERHEEADRWSAAGWDNVADGERLLLWHGSRSTNFAGILKQGLRIAPPEAPVTGYMFGKVRRLVSSSCTATDRCIGRVFCRCELYKLISGVSLMWFQAMSKSANYCHS